MIRTVYQILEEYLNRQKNPKYSDIGIVQNDQQSFSFQNISNLREEFDASTGWWLVFDSEFNGKKRHVKMKGRVIRYVEIIDE